MAGKQMTELQYQKIRIRIQKQIDEPDIDPRDKEKLEKLLKIKDKYYEEK